MESAPPVGARADAGAAHHAREGASARTAVGVVAVATVAGLLLGTLSSVADGHGGWLAAALSMPGPWIAATVAVAAMSARRSRARWLAPIATAAFLTTGIAGYYAAKLVTLGAIPGPLVAFWGALAIVFGLAVGVAGGAFGRRPWGSAALAGFVGGWLVIEAAVAPAAPRGEALAGVLGAGLVGHRAAPRGARWTALLGGASAGAAAAAAVFAVLSRALSTLL